MKKNEVELASLCELRENQASIIIRLARPFSRWLVYIHVGVNDEYSVRRTGSQTSSVFFILTSAIRLISSSSRSRHGPVWYSKAAEINKHSSPPCDDLSSTTSTLYFPIPGRT